MFRLVLALSVCALAAPAVAQVAPSSGSPVVPEGGPQFLPSTVAPSRDGVDRRVRIANQTGLQVRILQIGDERTTEFGENLIAGQPLSAGERRILVLDTGQGLCRFALRAELSSGEAIVRRDVNVCVVRDLSLTR